MANKNQFPDYSEKQKLLYGEDKNPALLNSYGERFLEAEMYDTALDFFIASENEERIRQLVDISIENGDFFIFKRAASIVLDEEEIRKKAQLLAENAKKLGKELFAKKALELAQKKDSVS
ncbi:MAG: hypothetical protein D6734_08995 [Candidatus Schekmanbacteria bacterium]|nr:MAG: hypothetical protein D6734_08995 [Candidatus Schekmanbacteria bacterium]